jgi:hypothetical protein
MDLRSIVKPARSVLTVLKVSSAKRLREELSRNLQPCDCFVSPHVTLKRYFSNSEPNPPEERAFPPQSKNVPPSPSFELGGAVELPRDPVEGLT